MHIIKTIRRVAAVYGNGRKDNEKVRFTSGAKNVNSGCKTLSERSK